MKDTPIPVLIPIVLIDLFTAYNVVGNVNNTLTTLLSNYTETPDFCVLGDTMFHTVQLDGSPYNTMLTMMPKRFVRVWIENKKTVTEPISISSFVGINNSAATDDSSQPWWFNFPNSDVPVQPAPQGQGGGGVAWKGFAWRGVAG